MSILFSSGIQINENRNIVKKLINSNLRFFLTKLFLYDIMTKSLNKICKEYSTSCFCNSVKKCKESIMTLKYFLVFRSVKRIGFNIREQCLR